ncbi:MAG: hypothetical protein OEM05_02045 [Myxococcales bacterium]|nr:hypothetical protein [Myxococcales bacterium]
MVRQTGRWAAVALALIAGSSACGDEDPLGLASGPSMQPSGNRDAISTRPSRVGNRAPRVESVRIEPDRLRAGQSVTAVVEASDPDGDSLSYRYEWRAGGVAARGSTFTSLRVRKGDAIELIVTASDGRAQSAPFRITTVVDNSVPEVRGIRIEPEGEITAGRELKVEPEGRDADGDPIAYRYLWWVNGSTVDQTGPLLSTAGLRRDDRIRVRVVATDGDGQSDAFESREITLANAAPVIVSEPGAAGADGVFRFRIRAEDPDGDRPLRYRLASAPDGMKMVSGAGAVEWRPRADQAGEHAVEVVVEDPVGGRTSQHFRLVVGDTPPAAPAP